METNIRIWDAGDRWFDRYTVQIGKDMYNMSLDADSPNGVNLYIGECDDGLPDGKVIAFDDLPEGTQRAIRQRQVE